MQIGRVALGGHYFQTGNMCAVGKNFPPYQRLYRINETARPVKERQKATALRYKLSSHPRKSLGFEGKTKDNLCNRGEKLHCGALSVVG